MYLDHARDVGAYNPCFPEYELTVDGRRATGTVTFPIAYEGPPGVVHGGFLALFFDCVVQHHNCDVGVAGKTTSLAIRYRRPTPLLTPLTVRDRPAGGGRPHPLDRPAARRRPPPVRGGGRGRRRRARRHARGLPPPGCAVSCTGRGKPVPAPPGARARRPTDADHPALVTEDAAR